MSKDGCSIASIDAESKGTRYSDELLKDYRSDSQRDRKRKLQWR